MFAKRALVCILLVTATACSSKGGVHRTATTSTTASSTTTRAATVTTAASSAPPAGAHLLDLSWISEVHGYALALTPGCDPAPGCLSLLTTLDGDNWSALSPPASLAGVSGLRFANATVGYAYGPGFMTTHDGGRTWATSGDAMVAAVEANNTDAIRLSYPTDGCPGPCSWKIERAATGSDTWRTLLSPKLTSSGVAAQLVRDGHNDVYAVFFGNPAHGAGDAHADWRISHDDGRTWTGRADPCGEDAQGEIDTRSAAAAPHGVVAALCETRVEDPPTASVVVSTDGGATFSARRVIATEYRGAIALTSASDIFVATGNISGGGPITYELDASHDGGRHWSPAITDHEQLEGAELSNSFLGFESSKVGRFVGYQGTIWTTTDGGNHWKPHRFA